MADQSFGVISLAVMPSKMASMCNESAFVNCGHSRSPAAAQRWTA
jgi:hypothetical protein